MYHAGMAGTRNVPIQTRLQSINSYNGNRENTPDNRKYTEEQKQPQSGGDSYKVTDQMKYLVEAETVSNIEDVKDNLQNKKLEISNSDMDETRKKISLQQLQTIEERCNLKIKQLRLELSIQKKIAKAEESGDGKQADRLRQEYDREKNLRKNGEYSELQNFLKNQQGTGEQENVYTIYNAKQKETQLLRKINQTGNFIDLQSV